MKRILCIWLPHWPIQRLVVARPELDGQAIVLHGPDARRGRRVVCHSAAAAARGVRLGMPLAEVAALADEAALHVEEHDGQADRQALEQLAGWCEPFSPLVGLEDAAAAGLFVVGCHRPAAAAGQRRGLGPQRPAGIWPARLYRAFGHRRYAGRGLGHGAFRAP